MKENRRLLARILMVAQEKGLDLKEVVSYPLCSVSSALGKFDGCMAKTNKATLMHEILNLVPDAVVTDSCLNSDVLIVDAMALIQQQSHFPVTFGDLADNILKQLLSAAKRHHAQRIDFVGDRYKVASIKMLERTKRGSMGHTLIRIQRRDQKLPKQMKKFLSSGQNKEGLLEFLVNDWMRCSPEVLGDTEVYATRGEDCFRLYVNEEGKTSVDEIADLHSDHEEADTRMFLHTAHAS